jgi:hypothetical protein
MIFPGLFFDLSFKMPLLLSSDIISIKSFPSLISNFDAAFLKGAFHPNALIGFDEIVITDFESAVSDCGLAE